MNDTAIPGNQHQSLRRREVVLGGLLLATAGAAALLQPRAATPAIAQGTLARALPKAFGAYRESGTSSLILPPASDLRDATYADLLMQTYGSGDGTVHLLAACGAANEAGLTIHRAEDCYPAFGFALSPLRTVALGGEMPRGTEGCFFTARRGERVEHVLYWVRIGNTFPASAWTQRLEIARANLDGILPSGVLLRLSVFDGGPDAALAAMQAFNSALLAHCGQLGRELLLGRA
jgi:hypothetical protein